MSVSLPTLSLAQQQALTTALQKKTYYPVTFTANRTANAFVDASGQTLIASDANSYSRIAAFSYTPTVACAVTAINWQGFFFNHVGGDFVKCSIGCQISYSSTFIDNFAGSFLIDTGNLLYWNEFSYGFLQDFGPNDVNKQRYSYFQSFDPYAYFVPANSTVYLYLYDRVNVLNAATLKVEESATLHLIMTNRTT